MDKEEQRESLRQDMQNVIDRHLLECDLSKVEIVGVIESVKLDCYHALRDVYEFTADLEGEEE
jgi:hypothetical protein